MHAKPLRDLDPGWMQDEEGPYALIFECPTCNGDHSIAVPFRDCEAARSLTAKGILWTLRSEMDFSSLTFSPSINLDHGTGCSFHGFVREGRVVW